MTNYSDQTRTTNKPIENVIIINDYAERVGGAAGVAIDSAIGLSKSGLNVYYLYGGGALDASFENSGVRLISLGKTEFLNRSDIAKISDFIYDRDVYRQATKIFSQFSKLNTIVHIHSWVKILSGSVLDAVIDINLPSVITLHDYFTICPNGALYNFPKSKKCSFKPMSLGCMKSNCDSRSYSHKIIRNFRQISYSSKKYFRKINNFIYVSNFSKEILEPSLPESAIFYNIDNPICFSKTEYSYGYSDFPRISWVGRLSPEKGLKERIPFFNSNGVILDVVGDGSELSMNKEMSKKNIIYHGWLDPENVADVIKNSQALLFTSRLYETQGLVVMEALSLGIPVIIPSDSAATDFVRDGFNGLIYDPESPGSLEKVVNDFLENSSKASEISKNAYFDFWKKPPTLKSHVEHLKMAYMKIIDVN